MMTMRVMGLPRLLAGTVCSHCPRGGPPHRTRRGGAAGRAVGSAPMGLYAAYGSNMDPAQMLRRCPASPHTGTGWIRGWRLTFGAEEFGWDGALATLVPDESPEQLHPGVFVALYDLTPYDEKALDAWEGADSGLYRRVHLRVHTLAGDVV